MKYKYNWSNTWIQIKPSYLHRPFPDLFYVVNEFGNTILFLIIRLTLSTLHWVQLTSNQRKANTGNRPSCNQSTADVHYAISGFWDYDLPLSRHPMSQVSQKTVETNLVKYPLRRLKNLLHYTSCPINQRNNYLSVSPSKHQHS